MAKFIIPYEEIEKMEVIEDQEHIRKYIPQRFEFEMISGLLYRSDEECLCVGFHDVPEEPFWARGHIPDRPLMPGVMMIEAAAQLSTYCYSHKSNDDKFIGFGGVDSVKFRGTVLPGDRVYIVAKNIEMRSRRMIFDTQAIVNGKLVFQGKVIGMHV